MNVVLQLRLWDSASLLVWPRPNDFCLSIHLLYFPQVRFTSGVKSTVKQVLKLEGEVHFTCPLRYRPSAARFLHAKLRRQQALTRASKEAWKAENAKNRF